jgi:hypothetical protein
MCPVLVLLAMKVRPAVACVALIAISRPIFSFAPLAIGRDEAFLHCQRWFRLFDFINIDMGEVSHCTSSKPPQDRTLEGSRRVFSNLPASGLLYVVVVVFVDEREPGLGVQRVGSTAMSLLIWPEYQRILSGVSRLTGGRLIVI